MAKGILATILERLRGYGTRLDDYELAIIEAVAHALPPMDADKLLRRAAAVNRVQRLLGGQDTTLYQMRGGRPVFPEETAILHQPGSIRFARVEVRSPEPTSRLRATLFLHDGNLTSLEFDRPSERADATHIQELRVTFLGPPFQDPDLEEEQSGWPSADR